MGSNELWRVVYGFAANGDRGRTWNLLRTLATQSSLPWLVAKDFNEILNNSEKFGGHLQGAAPMARFHSPLVDCNLVNMGYVGSKFTWFIRFTNERLDHACSTPSWSSIALRQ